MPVFGRVWNLKSISQNSFRSLLEFSVVVVDVHHSLARSPPVLSFLIQNPLCPTDSRCEWIQNSVLFFRNYPDLLFLPLQSRAFHLLLMLQPWPAKEGLFPPLSALLSPETGSSEGDKEHAGAFLGFGFEVQWFQLWPSISLYSSGTRSGSTGRGKKCVKRWCLRERAPSRDVPSLLRAT